MNWYTELALTYLGKLFHHVTLNILIGLPRPLGRGVIEPTMLALAAYMSFIGLKPSLRRLIIPRPKGSGNIYNLFHKLSYQIILQEND
jgi:hypothetical protein